MACGCGGGKNKAKVAYQVKYRDGTKETFAAVGLAQAAAAKKRGSVSVVKAPA